MASYMVSCLVITSSYRRSPRTLACSLTPSRSQPIHISAIPEPHVLVHPSVHRHLSTPVVIQLGLVRLDGSLSRWTRYARVPS